MQGRRAWHEYIEHLHVCVYLAAMAHGVYLRNSNGMEMELWPSSLTYRLVLGCLFKLPDTCPWCCFATIPCHCVAMKGGSLACGWSLVACHWSQAAPSMKRVFPPSTESLAAPWTFTSSWDLGWRRWSSNTRRWALRMLQPFSLSGPDWKIPVPSFYWSF